MLNGWILGSIFVVAAHVCGVLSGLNVLRTGRTPQGVIAWILFLATLPYIAVPLYWVFGPRKYAGYIDARMSSPTPFDDVVEELSQSAAPFMVSDDVSRPALESLERLVHLPLTGGNSVELLFDGDAIRRAIFDAIDGARDYVLLQFFIVRDDGIGRALKDKLIEAAARGVRVSFLFDQIGSRKLPRHYQSDLAAAGVDARAFTTNRQSNRFQLNFRNHRKLVIVDGLRAFIGGMNIGDEYLGHHPTLSPWRDTFVSVEGPSVQALQLSFLEDWHWMTDVMPEWNWAPSSPHVDPSDETRPGATGTKALVLPSGPADPYDTGGLIFSALIQAARTRLWISTPYFVVDSQIIASLQLAALRGVDVRILLPSQSDSALAYYAGCSYHADVLAAGCRVFRYERGFLHQKALLVDDHLSMLGTMNLDNRSMRLNFEISILVDDASFAESVSEMLGDDFDDARELTLAEVKARGWLVQLKSQLAWLFAPIL